MATTPFSRYTVEVLGSRPAIPPDPLSYHEKR
jgi:hypothetical protein